MANILIPEKRLGLYEIKILMTEEPEGGYTVEVPELPGCITYGENIIDGREKILEAMQLYVETKIDMGEEVSDSLREIVVKKYRSLFNIIVRPLPKITKPLKISIGFEGEKQ